jgi:hypothetical protein
MRKIKELFFWWGFPYKMSARLAPTVSEASRGGGRAIRNVPTKKTKKNPLGGMRPITNPPIISLHVA